MANKKIKFPLWLMPDTKATVECLYRQDGCNSQSEFIEKAIQFYCGYLQSEYAETSYRKSSVKRSKPSSVCSGIVSASCF